MNIFSRARHFGFGNTRSGGDGRAFSNSDGSATVLEPHSGSATFNPMEHEPKKKLPRIGFLGVGWIGRNRMEAIAKTGAVEIVGIADAVADNSSQAKQLASNAEVVTSAEDLF